jgi:transcriptional regulator with XRE-family HTH domain
VHIAERQHRGQLLLSFRIEPAAASEALRILVRAEQHVPPHDVAVVVAVAAVLLSFDTQVSSERNMTQVESLIQALKQVLKGRGVTYSELARRLGISESSVKRLLSRGGLTLERLEQICACLDTDFLELAKRMQREQAEPRDLTLKQEEALAEDSQLLAIAYHLINGWTPNRLRQDLWHVGGRADRPAGEARPSRAHRPDAGRRGQGEGRA